YSQRSEETVQRYKEQGESAGGRVQEKAREYGFAMKQTMMGTALVPMKNGEPMSNEEIQNLSPDEQAEIQDRKEKLQQEIESTQKEYRKINREAQKKLDELDRQVVANHLDGPLEDLRDEYGEFDAVNEYLDALKEDVQNNVDVLKSRNADAQNVPPQIQQQLHAQQEQFFSRFSVNVAVDNAKTDGAPVIVERNPTYTNLVGNIEKEMQMGALTTDFTMVKSGALLRANGGFLLLPLRDLLRNPYGWDALKRSLDAGKVEIEELQQQLGLMSVKTLKPQPVPLRTKVVLVGDPMLFGLLEVYDPGFGELFKVRADLETRMEDTDENRDALIGVLRDYASRENLGDISNGALSQLLTHAVRDAGRHGRLSVRMESLHDVLHEASFWAKSDGREAIEAEHIEHALEERIYRSALIRDRILELIDEGTILIDTENRRVGQVNGLSVVPQGEISFGRPTRITASVGPGKEGVVDIERQTELGGPIHNKGVMIISGFLSRLAESRPLGMDARLVFEQSYAQVEGDSASLAELIALVSTLAELPLRQDVAITGSVNQHGDVQAIGGVNEKIEGFYDVCAMSGLSGTQGVIIPESNTGNLMLRSDVADSVEKGEFHIWSVSRVDDAVEVLGETTMDEVVDSVRTRIDEMNNAIKDLGNG
ncbi:MAG: Lon protease family protein, partial [Spirochaetota bacterium]